MLERINVSVIANSRFGGNKKSLSKSERDIRNTGAKIVSRSPIQITRFPASKGKSAFTIWRRRYIIYKGKFRTLEEAETAIRIALSAMKEKFAHRMKHELQ